MEGMMLWVSIGTGILLILFPMLIGMMVSPLQQATRVELVKAPLDKVWEAVSELSRQTEWRTDLKSVQLKDDDDGMRWIENPARGSKITLRKLKEIEKKEIVVQMEKGSRVIGTRQAMLSAVPGGTRITFTETSEIKNPLSRLFAHLGGKLDKRLNHYIAQLKRAHNS
ncbi:MAG: SRPBCC family protein [Thiolinea sp.]